MTSTPKNRPFLSSAEMEKTVKALVKLAGESKVTVALCGGFAMQLYGSDRMTVDIDFIADAELPMQSEGPLSFGGIKYSNEGTPVDWIIRGDDQAFVYQQALDNRVKKSGYPVLSPEWLAVIKLLAGRSKDQSDLLFLLRQPKLVDRVKVKRIIKSLFGRGAFATQDVMEAAYLEADLMNAIDKKKE